MKRFGLFFIALIVGVVPAYSQAGNFNRLNLINADSATIRANPINGTIYYNRQGATPKFRAYQNGAWVDVISTGNVSGTGNAGELALWDTPTSLTSTTVIPDGTTATTQSVANASDLVATTDFVTNQTETVYNVKAYGAVGDGVTDDTNAIIAAIAACPAYGIVYFPNGTYIVTSTITINKSLNLLGESTYGAIVATASNSIGVFNFDKGSVGFLGAPSVKNMRFNNTSVSNPVSGYAIRFEYCENPVLDGTIINGFYDNLRIENCYREQIMNSYIFSPSHYGINKFTDDPLYVDFGDGIFFNLTFTQSRNAAGTIAFNQSNGAGTKINGCKFNRGQFQYTNAYVSTTTAGSSVFDVLITNSSFENTTGDAINISKNISGGNYADFAIVGNQFNGVPSGFAMIRLTRIVRAAVTGNTFFSSGGGTGIVLADCADIYLGNQYDAGFTSSTTLSQTGTVTNVQGIASTIIKGPSLSAIGGQTIGLQSALTTGTHQQYMGVQFAGTYSGSANGTTGRQAGVFDNAAAAWRWGVDQNGTMWVGATSSSYGMNVTGTGAMTLGGNTTQSGRLSFMEDRDNGTNTTTLIGPTTLAGDLTLTLPSAAPGGDGYALTATTGGTMSWAAMPAGLSGLTATRVPFATSATTLGDDADFFFTTGTNTLDVPNINSSSTLALTATTSLTGDAPTIDLDNSASNGILINSSGVTITGNDAGDAVTVVSAATTTIAGAASTVTASSGNTTLTASADVEVNSTDDFLVNSDAVTITATGDLVTLRNHATSSDDGFQLQLIRPGGSNPVTLTHALVDEAVAAEITSSGDLFLTASGSDVTVEGLSIDINNTTNNQVLVSSTGVTIAAGDAGDDVTITAIDALVAEAPAIDIDNTASNGIVINSSGVTIDADDAGDAIDISSAGTTNITSVAGNLNLTATTSTDVNITANDDVNIVSEGDDIILSALDDLQILPSGDLQLGSSNTDALSTSGIIYGSTWTPTLTAVSNVSGSGANVGQFARIGNNVSGSIHISVTPTAGATQTVIAISNPVPSNFGGSEQAGGTGVYIASVAVPGYIQANASDNRMEFVFISDDTSPHSFSITFQYLIQ